MLTNSIRDQLAAVEDRLRTLREEKSRAAKVAQAAKAAAAQTDDEASLAAAEAAVGAVRSIEDEMAESTEEQITLLRRLGDMEAGQAGFASPGIDGWDEAARTLSLATGDLRTMVPAASLLRSGPTLRPTPTSPTAPANAGRRWLYPALPSAPFGSSAGDLAATDYTVSFTNEELTGTTGPVQIETATDTEKATLSPTISLATVTAKTFAVVLDQVPSALFDNKDALRAFLSQELGRRITDALDAHVVDTIEAASPPSGSSGADLVARVRNAIAAMRDFGGEPTILAITPSEAAGLDLTVQPGTGDYVFRVDLEGSGNPVWSLQVREVPTISAPTLIDSERLGLTYLGEGSVLVDPFGANLKQNLVSVRAEIEGRHHVRNAQQGAFVIA